MTIVSRAAITRTTAVLIVAVIVIAAVGAAVASYMMVPSTKPQVKIAIVTDTGGRGDLAFNDMAFLGGDEVAKDFGVKVVPLISKVESDYTPNLRTAAQDPDVQLIIANGFLMNDALFQAAQEFPNKNFIGVETSTQDTAHQKLGKLLPNVIDFHFVQADRAALAGALAALLAINYKMPHIGGVLGIEIPPLWWLETGYKFGADWAITWYQTKFNVTTAPGIGETPKKERVLYAYTGTFSDVTKGYEAAKPMYASGAVAVYNMAGAMGLGINEAVAEIAKSKNLETGPPFWIGVDSDQDWINPGFVIASTTARNDRMVYYSTKLVLDNKFREAVQTYNGTVWFGLATTLLGVPVQGESLTTLDDLNEFIQMAKSAENMTGKTILPMPEDQIRAKVKAMRDAQPAWVWEGVSELQQKILSGEIKVPMPTSKEQIDYWRSIFG